MKNHHIKLRKKNNKKLILKKSVRKFIQKLFIMTIIFLVCMILVRKDEEFKHLIRKNVYENSFQFTRLRQFYQQHFGDILSIEELIPEVQPVFSERISYLERNTYEDGVKLIVNEKYLVPVIESGIIVFIGEKEGIGHTVVIEQIDGVSTWYSGVSTKNLRLYDYISQGSLLGEVSGNTLFLTFKRNGEILDYKEFI